MRRRFYELVAAGPKPIASETLKRIAALYANEKVIGRCALMRVRRCGRINTHRSLTFSNRGCAKTDAGQPEERPQAIRYALSRRNGLTLFVDDGRVEINSYVVQRAILRSLSIVRTRSSRALTPERKTRQSSLRS